MLTIEASGTFNVEKLASNGTVKGGDIATAAIALTS